MAKMKIKATTHKKGTDDMSDAHRKWLLRWEKFVRVNDIDHVWAVSPRDRGRKPGRVYLVVKRQAKRYEIVEADEAKHSISQVYETFESPTEAMKAFKTYRASAKQERAKTSLKSDE